MNNIISSIIILAAVGLSLSFTYPRYNRESSSFDIKEMSVKELQVEKIRYEAALAKTREIVEVRNGLLSKYNLISETDRQRLAKLIPDNIDSVRLIIDVNNVASDFGMTLRGINVSESLGDAPRKDATLAVPDSRRYSSVALDFSVSGVYTNLVSFLGALEKSLRIVDVTSIDITDGSGSDGGSA